MVVLQLNINMNKCKVGKKKIWFSTSKKNFRIIKGPESLLTSYNINICHIDTPD